MSLEKKIGQLIMADQKEAERLVREAHVGAFILFGPPEAKLEGSLLYAVDQEGVRVNRLPPPYAQELGKELAAQLREIGINLNLAPIVDDGPVTLKMTREDGVGVTLKHFPGRGDRDPHWNRSRIDKDLEELWAENFVPYIQLIDEADVVMMGHVLAPAIDPSRPTSRSPEAVRLLREEIGFEGVILTDSVVMAGFFEGEDFEEAVIQALEAGCDIVMLAGKAIFELTVEDVLHLHRVLVEAVEEGRIPESQIDASVERVCKLKASLGI